MTECTCDSAGPAQCHRHGAVQRVMAAITMTVPDGLLYSEIADMIDGKLDGTPFEIDTIAIGPENMYGPAPAQPGREDLELLLAKADLVVTWTTQDTLRDGAAGLKALIAARQDYYKARIDIMSAVRPLTTSDTGGCTCGWTKGSHAIRPGCMYHYAAARQPWNHRIPWNCPSYYDGCNCDPPYPDEEK